MRSAQAAASSYKVVDELVPPQNGIAAVLIRTFKRFWTNPLRLASEGSQAGMTGHYQRIDQTHLKISWAGHSLEHQVINVSIQTHALFSKSLYGAPLQKALEKLFGKSSFSKRNPQL